MKIIACEVGENERLYPKTRGITRQRCAAGQGEGVDAPGEIRYGTTSRTFKIT